MSPSSSSSGAPSRAGKPVVPRINEDWLALIIGLFLFLLSLPGLAGADVFGWAIKTNVWTRVSQVMTPVSRNYPNVRGIASLILSYFLLLGILTIAAKWALRVRISKFVIAFTLVFFVSYLCYAAGHSKGN